MKNVQVIDGALNCEYAVYAFTDDQFKLIFPAPDQNVEFIDDVIARLSSIDAEFAFDGVWDRKIDKRSLTGLHGTLFYELSHKKIYYPTKRDDDMWDGNSARAGMHEDNPNSK